MAWNGGAPDWQEFSQNPAAYAAWQAQQRDPSTQVDAVTGVQGAANIAQQYGTPDETQQRYGQLYGGAPAVAAMDNPKFTARAPGASAFDPRTEKWFHPPPNQPETEHWFRDAYPGGYFGGGGGVNNYDPYPSYPRQPAYGGGNWPGWSYGGGGYDPYGYYPNAQGMGGINYDWASQMGGPYTNQNRQAQAEQQRVPSPWQANIARYNEMSPTGRGLLQGAAGQAGYDWSDYQTQMRAAAPQGQPIRQTNFSFQRPRGAYGGW